MSSQIQDDNFDDVQTVDPIDFVNAKFDRYGTTEYIRAFAYPESGELRLYRQNGDEPGDQTFIRTVLDGVKVLIRETEGRDSPAAFNLHKRDAQNLLTWLGLFAKERSDPWVTFEYYSETGMPMMEDSRFGVESLHFGYETPSGRYFQTEIRSVYRNETQMIARFS